MSKKKNEHKQIKKNIKKMKQELSKEESKLKRSCYHGDKKGTYLQNFREEGGVRVATCAECLETVIVDEDIINSSAELVEAFRIIDANITLAILAAKNKFSKETALSDDAINVLTKTRGVLISFVNERVDTLQKYERGELNAGSHDDDEDEIFSGKKGAKNSTRKLF